MHVKLLRQAGSAFVSMSAGAKIATAAALAF